MIDYLSSMIKKTKQEQAISQEQINGNYVLVDRRALYFVGVLILALTFSTGMFYAKSKSTGGSAGVTTQAAPTASPQQQQQQPQAVNVSMDQIRGLFGNGNITFGDKNSKLVLVEFSDPSCPYCSAAGGLNPTLNKQMGTQFVLTSDGGSYVAPVPEMKKLVDSGKAAMVWVYARGHGNGELSTQALYCANEKGKFWAVHDLLMATD